MDRLSGKLVFTLLLVVVVTTILSTFTLFYIEQSIAPGRAAAFDGKINKGDVSIRLITPEQRAAVLAEDPSSLSIKLKE